ncbi:hypothetical protein [Geodermatophilus marinus]|nr:hypothetical protein [Geodermatophilus sp. LHW52908]
MTTAGTAAGSDGEALEQALLPRHHLDDPFPVVEHVTEVPRGLPG